MIKKMLLILLSFCTSLNAGDENFSFQSQELFYEAGVSLAFQDKISDWATLKKAAVGVYDKVEELSQLVDLLLMADDNLVDEGVVTFGQLLDKIDLEFSDNDELLSLQADLVELIAAYQQIFYLFVKMYPSNHSRQIFSTYLAGSWDSENYLEVALWYAIDDFMNLYESISNKLDEIL